MCRNKDERMERCDCDTSEARRLRRHTRDALDRHAMSAYQPVKPNFLTSAIIEKPFTTESVRDEIQSIPASVYELRELGESSDSIQAVVDRKLNTIGAGVEHLAENKYGAPTDQEIRDSYKSFEKPFLEHKANALNAGKTEEEAASEAADKIDLIFIPTMEELIEKRNYALRNALIDVGVKFANPKTLKCSAYSDDRAVDLLKKCIVFYPQSWVDASNRHPNRKLSVRTISPYERAGYQTEPVRLGLFNRRSTLSLSEGEDFAGGVSVGIHEFAHRVEHSVPGITNFEQFFLKRRSGHYSTDENPTTPEEISLIVEEGDEDGEEEFGYKDNFPTHYMGRVYGGDNAQYSEILAMGMESLFTGTNGGLAGVKGYKEDSDYKKFILGVLASSAT